MNHEESNLQQQCVAWFRAQYPQYAMLLTHPINEGSGHTKTDRRRQGIHKAEGAVAGVPDLLLFMPSRISYLDKDCVEINRPYHGLGVEMKTAKGVLSRQQKEFQYMFMSAGYFCIVVRSLEDFIRIINEWIAGADADMRKNIAAAHVEIEEARKQREKEHFLKVIGKK